MICFPLTSRELIFSPRDNNTIEVHHYQAKAGGYFFPFHTVRFYFFANIHISTLDINNIEIRAISELKLEDEVFS